MAVLVGAMLVFASCTEPAADIAPADDSAGLSAPGSRYAPIGPTASQYSQSYRGFSGVIRGLIVLSIFDAQVTGQHGDPAALAGSTIATSDGADVCPGMLASLPPQCPAGGVRLINLDADQMPSGQTWRSENGRKVTWINDAVVIGTWVVDGIAVEWIVPIVLGEETALAGIITHGGAAPMLCTTYRDPPSCTGTPIPLLDLDASALPTAGLSGDLAWTPPVIVTGTWEEGGVKVIEVVPDDAPLEPTSEPQALPPVPVVTGG